MHNITTKKTATVAPPAMLARSSITPFWAAKKRKYCLDNLHYEEVVIKQNTF